MIEKDFRKRREKMPLFVWWNVIIVLK